MDEPSILFNLIFDGEQMLEELISKDIWFKVIFLCYAAMGFEPFKAIEWVDCHYPFYLSEKIMNFGFIFMSKHNQNDLEDTPDLFDITE